MSKVIPLDMTKLTKEPFVNLTVEILHSAMTDWQRAHITIKQLGGEEVAYKQWLRNIELLHNEPNKYFNNKIERQIKKYIRSTRVIVEIEGFIQSKWFDELCCCIDLEPEAVAKEFSDIKNYIYNNEV